MRRKLLGGSQFIVYGAGTHYLYDHEAFGFRNDEMAELMDRKYMGIGLSKSVKVLEDDGRKFGPFVVADVKRSAFHADGQNLLDKISHMSVFFDHRTGMSSFSVALSSRPGFLKSILQIIKGLYVTTLYGKKKTFPIGGIGAAANALRFKSADGSHYTIEQYFKKHYNIQLKCPGLFTVSERHKPHSYYPVELLSVAPSQRVTQQQQTPDDVAAIIRASATLPQHRLNETKVMKNALRIAPGNPFLERAGINVEKEFTKVIGRILIAPTIVYGGSGNVKVNNCKWIWDRAQFLRPAKLLNWAVCVTLAQGDLQRVPVKNYIERIKNRCRSHGMQVATVSDVFYLKRRNYDGVEEWYEAQMKKSRTYLMFITSDNIHLHDTIKLLELQYQIVSQEIRAGKVVAVVSKNQNQTLDNVVAKVNHKFGGINYNIVLDLAPKYKSWLSDSSIVFIGFEISNPPALSKFEIERGATYKMPSVLGWGANCTGNPQQFIGDHTYVEARQSDMMGSKLGELVNNIIKKHRAATSVSPQHIIYFSGVSEGQLIMLSDTYMRTIYTGLASLSLGREPNVTALAVSKDHNERLYKLSSSSKRAAYQNIPGGTVVDTKIVSPIINEFYLNAHATFQGTAKTPKYSLVADTSQLPPDVIERLTYGLCYLHEIISTPVSVPVPLLVDDRCAKRGHNVYVANSNQHHIVVNNIKEANEHLVNNGDLQKVRYNA